MYEEEQLSNKSVLFNCCKNRNLKSSNSKLKGGKTMALIETVADHDYAAAVEVLSREVMTLNRELKEQKEINENLFCAIRNLTDAVRDQNELMQIVARNNQ